LSHAKQNSSDEPDLFSAALGYLSGNKQQIADEDDIDESQAINSYKATYGGEGRGQQHGSETLGAGAAIEALKMFTGEGAGQGGMGSQGAGNSQSQLIGMAMAQAATLFDKQSSEGNVDPSASKQSAVNAAAKMALKMYLKGQSGGGGGGPGGLMGIANKFL
jgi:hypothetical protein